MNPTHPHAPSQRRSHQIIRYFSVFLLVVLPTVNLAQDSMKSWTNTSGKTIQAEFIKIDGDSVVIQKDGKVFNFPLGKLSVESHEQARKLAQPTRTCEPINRRSTQPNSAIRFHFR